MSKATVPISVPAHLCSLFPGPRELTLQQGSGWLEPWPCALMLVEESLLPYSLLKHAHYSLFSWHLVSCPVPISFCIKVSLLRTPVLWTYWLFS